jgi:hypothetical protein
MPGRLDKAPLGLPGGRSPGWTANLRFDGSSRAMPAFWDLRCQDHISRLPAKLKRVGARDVIDQVPGEGYRLPEQCGAMFGSAPSFAFDGYLRLSPPEIGDEERMDEA